MGVAIPICPGQGRDKGAVKKSFLTCPCWGGVVYPNLSLLRRVGDGGVRGYPKPGQVGLHPSPKTDWGTLQNMAMAWALCHAGGCSCYPQLMWLHGIWFHCNNRTLSM